MTAKLSERFGIAVRQLRVERRWSQIELAGRSDLDRSYVGEIERGEVVVSILTAEKIARAMEMDLSHLFVCCTFSEPRITANGSRLLPSAVDPGRAGRDNRKTQHPRRSVSP